MEASNPALHRIAARPKLADEYDSHIAPIYRILTGSRSEDDLIECLYRTEHDQIGTGCESPEQLRPVARKLLALDVTAFRACVGGRIAVPEDGHPPGAVPGCAQPPLSPRQRNGRPG